MMHWRAKRLLSRLLEDELPRDESSRVRAHVERCARCRLELREYEVSAALLGRMPRSLIPMDWTLASKVRLRSAVGIAVEAGFGDANGLAFRAVAATTSMAIVLLLVTVGPLSPQRPLPRQGTGILSTVEKESTLLASAYEPPGGWGRN